MNLKIFQLPILGIVVLRPWEKPGDPKMGQVLSVNKEHLKQHLIQMLHKVLNCIQLTFVDITITYCNKDLREYN